MTPLRTGERLTGEAVAEVWLPVVGHPRWMVSNLGRVMGPRREVKGTPAVHGRYPTVRIGDKGNQQTFHKHRLVAMAFLGPRPDGLHVAHLDGNPQNNALSNLAYVTPRVNHSHKAVHGTQPRGGQVASAKLTDDVVRQIKAGAFGQLHAEIADGLSVSRRTITDIFNGKTWRHIDV